ncbi:hypothetical protein [Aquitalea aquatilis]|uniref:hypothetical protein n=1 Tax=Aquitalea aquatilis TaxID=1537400 RepID=UPI0010BD801E|nr:hypothetical protein [Aquitalea aquatilis]
MRDLQDLHCQPHDHRGAFSFDTTMRKPLAPTTTFECDKLELARLLFSHDRKASAAELGVTVRQWSAWTTGAKPVPRHVWLYLKQKKDMERLGDWQHVQIDRNRLVLPWGEKIGLDELALIREYRRTHQLAQEQADLIERLMMERDFYKENCHRQAKFGLMLNNLFKPS